MQRERLFKTFFKTTNSRTIYQLQFPLYRQQTLSGLFIAVFAVGFLKLFSELTLMLFPKITHHVFSLVPLASLNQCFLPKDRLDPIIKTIGAINDEQYLVLYLQSPID